MCYDEVSWSSDDHLQHLFDYEPGETFSRQERIDALDSYFETCVDHGMPFEKLPNTYDELLLHWEGLWLSTCKDLAQEAVVNEGELK